MATTFAAGPYDEVVVFFTDHLGEKKKTLIRVAHAASTANVEALIAAMQAGTVMSIQGYHRIVDMIGSGYPTAPAYNPSTSPYGQLTQELRLLYTCGPGKVNTRSSLFGPLGTPLIAGPSETIVGDLTNGIFTAIQTAAQAVQVNTQGAAVATLEEARLFTTKASQ
jgi:hypothetical protein